MRISADATIAREKLTEYLLRFRDKDDKSKFLGLLGFTLANSNELETAIRATTAANDAICDRETRFGSFYVVHGLLAGPLGSRAVVIIWLNRGVEAYSFVTLYPDKEQSR